MLCFRPAPVSLALRSFNLTRLTPFPWSSSNGECEECQKPDSKLAWPQVATAAMDSVFQVLSLLPRWGPKNFIIAVMNR